MGLAEEDDTTVLIPPWLTAITATQVLTSVGGMGKELADGLAVWKWKYFFNLLIADIYIYI